MKYYIDNDRIIQAVHDDTVCVPQNAYPEWTLVQTSELYDIRQVLPQKPATLEDLSQFLYQQKCKIAYVGVTVIKDGISYIFETNQDSITMCNSMALALNTQPDTTQITWKVWKDNTPTMLIISKAEFNAVFSFGMLMINTAFSVQGLFNQQLQTITQQQLADTVFVEEFKTNAISEFSKINTTLTI